MEPAGSTSVLETSMGWGPGPACCSTKCSGIHWQGRSSICPRPCDTESRLLSLPILWAICPGRTLWTQALTENVHVPEGFWRPQDCSFQHEMLRSVVEFCGKFIHTYSYLTEKEMPSVIFWLPKCCSCIKKRDFFPSSGLFTGSSHQFTYFFEQHPNWVQHSWASS